MKSKHLLLVLILSFCAALFAAPSRTGATSKPQVLRDQKIGEPFVEPERKIDTPFISSEKIKITQGLPEGRLLEITVFLLPKKNTDELKKSSKNDYSNTQDGENIIDRVKPYIVPGSFATFQIREGGSIIKPFDFAYITAVDKNSNNPASTFDKAGKFIKSENIKPQTASFGSYAAISVAEQGAELMHYKYKIAFNLEFAFPKIIQSITDTNISTTQIERMSYTASGEIDSPIFTNMSEYSSFFSDKDMSWAILIKEIPENKK